MPQLTKEWIDRQEFIAENTYVAETASGVIVVAHPGQQPPDNKDRKYLRQNFGLLETIDIKRLIDTEHAPPIERLRRELDMQDSPIAERLAYHEREFVKLKLEEAAAMGLPLTAGVVREAQRDLDDAAARAQDPNAGDPDQGRTVSTVGRGRSAAPKKD